MEEGLFTTLLSIEKNTEEQTALLKKQLGINDISVDKPEEGCILDRYNETKEYINNARIERKHPQLYDQFEKLAKDIEKKRLPSSSVIRVKSL